MSFLKSQNKCLLKVIVFDFDGVLVDSNKIKLDAYYKVFSEYNGSKEIVNEVINQFEPNTRKFIINKIVEQLSKKGLIDAQNIPKYQNRFIREYGEICEKEISYAPEVKGAWKSIRNLSKKYCLYVNSLTPIKPLNEIMKKRGIRLFFKGVFGGEKTKIENLKRIISLEKISPNQLLVIGDGINDLKSAQATGAHFIGIDRQDGILTKENIRYLLEDCDQLCNTVKRMAQ